MGDNPPRSVCQQHKSNHRTQGARAVAWARRLELKKEGCPERTLFPIKWGIRTSDRTVNRGHE